MSQLIYELFRISESSPFESDYTPFSVFELNPSLERRTLWP